MEKMIPLKDSLGDMADAVIELGLVPKRVIFSYTLLVYVAVAVIAVGGLLVAVKKLA